MPSGRDNEWPLRADFISYRWEGDEHEAWVRAFAHGLRARGYPVVLDRDVMEEPGSPTSRLQQIPYLFARLADVTHFTPILTDGYQRRLVMGDEKVKWEDGWVYDEWTIAMKMSIGGKLSFQGIWRAGETLPPPFTEHNVADFRGDDLDADLNRWYPRFEVAVVGERPDKTRRMIGPVLYTDYPAVLRRLRSQGEAFEKVMIVPKVVSVRT